MRARGWVVGAVFFLLGHSVAGQSPPVPFGRGSGADTFAVSVRRYLVEQLPPVLLEETDNWGEQKMVTRGLEWKGKGKFLPQAQKSHKNHGVWRKMRISTMNLRDTLIFDLRDVKQVGPGHLTFTTFVAFDAQADYEQQNWRSGVRTYAGSATARFRVRLTLVCEAVTRTEKNGGFVPDLVFRMRVLTSDLQYDNFKTIHVAGVGGELAELIGGAAKGAVNQWRPSLERNLMAKANAAIVKAGDTKEVRVSLSKLLGE